MTAAAVARTTRDLAAPARPATPALAAVAEARNDHDDVVVHDYLDHVDGVRDGAVLVDDWTPKVVELLSFDEATRAAAGCRSTRAHASRAADGVAGQLAALWQAGKKAVRVATVPVEGSVDGEQVPVTVRRRKDRREWDHLALCDEVITRKLAGRDPDDVPDPLTVARWVLEACQPAYWRLHVLLPLGIDPDDFARVVMNTRVEDSDVSIGPTTTTEDQ